ncbi:hypothetical protein [Actinacidiphila sp. bgisy160]|uniref:hypothetical protein n=1 Tax=Actinacidiphila sp. bgisy160 TaxID=3413796 RepID=UPI003D723704
MRKTIPVLGVAGAMIAGMLTLATPAAAHTMRAYVYTYAGFVVAAEAAVYDGHEHGYVCDRDADGLGVYGRFKLNDGKIYDVADSDGAGGTCPGFTAPTGKYITAFEAVLRSDPPRGSGWKTP